MPPLTFYHLEDAITAECLYRGAGYVNANVIHAPGGQDFNLLLGWDKDGLSVLLDDENRIPNDELAEIPPLPDPRVPMMPEPDSLIPMPEMDDPGLRVEMYDNRDHAEYIARIFWNKGNLIAEVRPGAEIHIPWARWIIRTCQRITRYGLKAEYFGPGHPWHPNYQRPIVRRQEVYQTVVER